MPRTAYYDTLNGVTSVPAGLLQAIEERSVYVIKDAENPQSLTPGYVLYVMWKNVRFWYDPLDSTTTHDGTTCIVTADGKRFKSDGFAGKASRITPVINRTTTTPPSSPANGDTYLVATGATGAWAGKDKMLASYTARGWVFLAPNTYDIVYSVADAGYYFYNASAVWTSGLPALTIGDNTVSPAKFKYAKFGLGVVNQTTNTPPSSPSDGDAYIIGTSPTGAWSGNARKIAIYEGSAWVIYSPQPGWQVYDRAQFASFIYDSGVWNSLASGIASEKIATRTTTNNTSNDLTISTTSVASFGINTAGTFPTTAKPYYDTGLSITHQCGSGKTLEFSVDCSFVFNTNSSGSYNGGSFGLFVDSGATAVDWTWKPLSTVIPVSTASAWHSASTILTTTASDSSSHTYKIFFFPYTGLNTGTNAFPTTFRIQSGRLVMRQLA